MSCRGFVQTVDNKMFIFCHLPFRSSSCDSYFEPWQAELAEMRLRLSPQERDHHMFSEEDDTQLQLNNAQVRLRQHHSLFILFFFNFKVK